MLSKIKPVCQEFSHIVWLYMDREMNPGELEYWDTHLQQCRNCRALLEDNKGVLAAYESLAAEEPDIARFDLMADRASGRFRMPKWACVIRRQMKMLPYHPLQFAYKSAFVFTIVIAAILISLNRDSSHDKTVKHSPEVIVSEADEGKRYSDNTAFNESEFNRTEGKSTQEVVRQPVRKEMDWRASEVKRRIVVIDQTMDRIQKRDVRRSPGIKDVIDEWKVSVVSINEGIEKLQKELTESSSF